MSRRGTPPLPLSYRLWRPPGRVQSSCVTDPPPLPQPKLCPSSPPRAGHPNPACPHGVGRRASSLQHEHGGRVDAMIIFSWLILQQRRRWQAGRRHVQRCAPVLLMVGAHRKSLLAAGGGVDRRTFSLLFGSSSRLSMRKHSERSCGGHTTVFVRGHQPAPSAPTGKDMWSKYQ